MPTDAPKNRLVSMLFAIVIAALFAVFAGKADAKDVGNACLAAERSAGQQNLCRCIQRAADQTLSRKDQKRAAGFFADPDLAETARRSDTRRDEAFWDRYEAFGDVAQKFCSRS